MTEGEKLSLVQHVLWWGRDKEKVAMCWWLLTAFFSFTNVNDYLGVSCQLPEVQMANRVVLPGLLSLSAQLLLFEVCASNSNHQPRGFR